MGGIIRTDVVRPLLPCHAMDINWKTDVDAALADAKQAGRPALIDFTAAPL